MSNREFTATRTMLANAFATAGAELLDYMGTAAALAAIPNTDPPQYVVAGTLAMIAKVLPSADASAEAAAAVLTDEVRAAMKRAYNLGQTYWQQADSECRFIELTDEICSKVERLAHAGVTAEPADALQIAEPSFAGWYVRKDSDGAIVVHKSGRGGCVLGGPHEDIENIEHTIFYAFLNDLMAAPAPAAPVQTETDQLQDQLTGAMYALRHIAAGVENPEQCAASALEVIARLNAAAPAPQDDEPEDSAFYPPKALLKREDWDPSTRKPKATQAIEMEDALAAPVQAEQAQAEPLAWMNPETLDVIHDARKRAWENDFGMGGKAKAAGYTYRLVAPAQVPAAEVRAQALPGWERGIATVTMNGHQLREALEFINPGGDDDADERDNDLTFGIVQHENDDGNAVTGLCCWNDDSDGVLPLSGEPSTADKASEVRAAEWISVEDTLPEDDCRVIAATWRTMTADQHIDIVSFRRGTGAFSEYPVTHWMPLPAAPSTADSANTGALGEKGADRAD